MVNVELSQNQIHTPALECIGNDGHASPKKGDSHGEKESVHHQA
jgi:hypothetical protein